MGKKTAPSARKTDQRASSAEDKKLGGVIRARRLEIGMSQERLAEILGITFQQVQKYEKGVNRVATSRLFSILRALELTFEEFIERMGLRPGVGDESAPFPANSKEAKLAVLYRKASPPVQEKIIALMEALMAENGH